MSHLLLVLLVTISCQLSSVTAGWPEGTYGLPRSISGCPTDDVFKWNYGKRIHLTRQGSYSSPSNNLFGSNPNKSDIVVQGFCIKNESNSDGMHRFMPGKYCIFKKGRCPVSFKEGSIYWDDGGPLLGKTIQSASGDLPDGIFDRNTRIEFCCRTDGHHFKAIDLPADQPFYLLKYGDMCQQVSRMTVTEHWVHWVDEKFLNLNHLAGVHPKVIRPRHPPPYTRLYYCYYEPPDTNYPSAFASHSEVYPQFSFGVQTILTIIYVTGAILAIIFMLALLLTGCQKIFVHIRKHRRSHTSCNSQESSHLNRTLSYPKTTGTSSPAVSSLSPPPYQQLPMGPLMFRGIRDQRTSEDSLVMCEDGEPPPPYEEVLREQAIQNETRHVIQ